MILEAEGDPSMGCLLSAGLTCMDRLDNRGLRRSALAVLIGMLALKATAAVAQWPPSDPGEPRAGVAFTPAWAMMHRHLNDFRQLQAAAGSKGRLASYERNGNTSRAVFTWTGRFESGSLRAFVYQDGSFGAIVSLTAGGGEIVFNSFGAFVCPACVPPIDACGRRPSWIPHDVHWDTFDCPHTLTGPPNL